MQFSKKLLFFIPVMIILYEIGFSRDFPRIEDPAIRINQSGLIISEVCDPADQYKGRFVELYNAGQVSIDFSTDTWYLSRQANGSTWADVILEGIIFPGECHIIAKNTDDFLNIYGFSPEQSSGIISGNGDDGYYLFSGGDHSTGIMEDAYGVVDQDGTGEPWEYLDSKAVRRFEVVHPNCVWTSGEWSIFPDANTNLMTPGIHKEYFSWNGAYSDDWNYPGNWDFSGNEEFIPDVSCIVSFPNVADNWPALTDTAFVHSLFLCSDSLNASSLLGHEKLFVDSLVTARYSLTGGNAVKEDDPDAVYHFLTSVVTNPEAGNVFPPSAFVRSWNEPLQEWFNLSGMDTLWPGLGYSVYLPDGPDTIVFQGRFIAGSVSPAIDYTQGGPGNPDYNGYNLVGNPYPSCIDWDEGSWVKTNIDASIALWSQDYGGYIYWNGTIGGLSDGIIPSGQGFFVRANDLLPELTIPMDARVVCNDPIFDDQKTVPDLLCLRICGEYDYCDEIYIHFKKNATWGYDNQADARKLYGLENAPQLLSRDEDQNALAINVVPPDNKFISVDVEFFTGYNGDFQLTSTGIESFEPLVSIFMEDHKTGEMIDLFNHKSYSFYYSTQDDPKRFTLHFSGLTAEEEVSDNEKIKIIGNTILVDSDNGKAHIEVYDLSGKLIFSREMNRLDLDHLNIKGFFVLRVKCDNSYFIKKMIVL